MKAQGTVKNIYDKVVKGGKSVYSFRLKDDDTYYRTSFTKPTFSEGDEVRFDYDETQYGMEVVVKSIQSKAGSGGGGSSSGGGAKKPAGRDSYWEEKDRYDKEVRNPTIMYQSATNAAVQLGIAALEGGILPTAGSKKADKFDSFMDIVREIRNEIYLDYEQAVVKCEAGVPIVTVDVPEATSIEDTEKPAAATKEFVPSDDIDEDDDWS